MACSVDHNTPGLLKQRLQPERSGSSRRESIMTARSEILYDLEDSPSYGATWRNVVSASTNAPSASSRGDQAAAFTRR